ncbi:MAG: protein kinase domain-containing protein [Bradymonadia bacterium]
MRLCPTCGQEFDASQERCPTDGTALMRVKDAAADRDAALIGRTLDKRYVIDARLGAGGMGTVYVATQTAVGRKVAIKLLPDSIASDMGAVKRFMQEAKAASTLSHPNVVTIHDFGQTDEGHLFLVMELVEGQTLARVLKNEGALDPERAVRIAVQILNAVEDAHNRGIVHRDLKPENVIISPRSGNPDFAKVLDFGLAKIADDASPGGDGLTKTGQVFGTPAYMSPEQARGERCDLRTDLYAVGVMLYEMLSGRRPFDGESPISILVKHMHEPPPSFELLSPSPNVPQPIIDAVRRALAKTREGRFENAAEMRNALEGGAAVRRSHFSMPALATPNGDLGFDSTIGPDDLKGSESQSLRSVSKAPSQRSVPSGFLGQVSLQQVSSGGLSMPPVDAGSKSRTPWIIAAVSLGLAVGGIALYAFQDKPAPMAVAMPSAAPVSRAPTSARVTFEATPAQVTARVTVTANGVAEPPRLIDRLPVTLDVPVGARIAVNFTADGHVPVDQTVQVDGAVTLHADLRPVPPPPVTVAVESAAPPPSAVPSRRPGVGPVAPRPEPAARPSAGPAHPTAAPTAAPAPAPAQTDDLK